MSFGGWICLFAYFLKSTAVLTKNIFGIQELFNYLEVNRRLLSSKFSWILLFLSLSSVVVFLFSLFSNVGFKTLSFLRRICLTKSFYPVKALGKGKVFSPPWEV
jgi:hypothetical protein